MQTAPGSDETLVGVIADTHGLLRPEALAALTALTGCDEIIHAGDVGTPDVLAVLADNAPLTAVRGNIDHGPWAEALPRTATITIAGCRVHVLHDVKEMRIDPGAEGIDVVVSGHAHRPSIEVVGGVLYVNPGSAGPQRFKLPVSMAQLVIRNGRAEADLIPLHP